MREGKTAANKTERRKTIANEYEREVEMFPLVTELPPDYSHDNSGGWAELE
jgi:hypothetical protein